MEKRHGVIKLSEEHQKDFDMPYIFVNPTFNSFYKAYEVLEKLKVDIKLFGNTRVAYLYQLSDRDTEVKYEDTCYGWKDLSSAKISRETHLCNVTPYNFDIAYTYSIDNLPEPSYLG